MEVLKCKIFFTLYFTLYTLCHTHPNKCRPCVPHPPCHLTSAPACTPAPNSLICSSVPTPACSHRSSPDPRCYPAAIMFWPFWLPIPVQVILYLSLNLLTDVYPYYLPRPSGPGCMLLLLSCCCIACGPVHWKSFSSEVSLTAPPLPVCLCQCPLPCSWTARPRFDLMIKRILCLNIPSLANMRSLRPAYKQHNSISNGPVGLKNKRS